MANYTFQDIVADLTGGVSPNANPTLGADTSGIGMAPDPQDILASSMNTSPIGVPDPLLGQQLSLDLGGLAQPQDIIPSNIGIVPAVKQEVAPSLVNEVANIKSLLPNLEAVKPSKPSFSEEIGTLIGQYSDALLKDKGLNIESPFTQQAKASAYFRAKGDELRQQVKVLEFKAKLENPSAKASRSVVTTIINPETGKTERVLVDKLTNEVTPLGEAKTPATKEEILDIFAGKKDISSKKAAENKANEKGLAFAKEEGELFLEQVELKIAELEKGNFIGKVSKEDKSEIEKLKSSITKPALKARRLKKKSEFVKEFLATSSPKKKIKVKKLSTGEIGFMPEKNFDPAKHERI